MKKSIKYLTMCLALSAIVLTMPAKSAYASTKSETAAKSEASTSLTEDEQAKILKGSKGILTTKSTTPKESKISTSAKSTSTSSGGTYITTSERGIKRLCYSKDQVIWTTNSSKITDYDAEQSTSGLFVEVNGIVKKKTLSTSTKYALLCKHTFLIGAVLEGITLGYNSDINDMLYIYQDGSTTVDWDY